MEVSSHIPLAERLRPETLDQYIGQEHLIAKGAILRNAIENNKIPSMIFWGPPGVGKTSLANIMAKQLDRPFYVLSAIQAGVKDVREVFEKARMFPGSILFIDEIHRFNKAQQDALLGAVERGIITLIGATTENPSFEVISPLLSRCQVYILKSLDVEHLDALIDKALDYIRVEKGKTIVVKEREAFYRVSGGDARKLYNAIELVVNAETSENIEITDEFVLKVIQQNLAMYDKNGEMHYDVISAFIKSMRGSDPNAAIYWLARMIEAGEDPLFIARRMVILASEDIGNANPNALLLANACFDAVNKIGYPECRITLAQTVIYLATSPKSNASYVAIDDALAMVRKAGDLSVPLHIRNAPTSLMKKIGYGKDYKYAHEFEGNFVDQEFLPEKISGTMFYNPGNNARENEIRQRMRQLWKNRYKF